MRRFACEVLGNMSFILTCPQLQEGLALNEVAIVERRGGGVRNSSPLCRAEKQPIGFDAHGAFSLGLTRGLGRAVLLAPEAR